MEAKEGEIDRVLKELTKIQAFSNSDQEPGCQEFRVCHSGNKILIFEKCVS